MKFLAALIFFTRLPFWRLASPDTADFKRVVDYWPFVGWFTGGFMAITLWLAAQILPLSTAIILALLVRLLFTGALHEDGLADCCDGFGGGTSRERTLAILKDSHIGTYGILGLLFYYGLLYSILSALPLSLACIAIFCGDAWSKCCASQLINLLPYARKEEDAKTKMIYDRMTHKSLALNYAGGIFPTVIVITGLLPLPTPEIILSALASPLFVMGGLQAYFRRRIDGYTGDCCGATFLLCELAYYFTVLLVYINH